MQGGAPLVTFVGLKPPVTKFDIYIYKYVYVCISIKSAFASSVFVLFMS